MFKKLFETIILFSVILFIFSCTTSFDPRLYNKRPNKNNNKNETSGGWIVPTPSEDPFLKTGEWWNNQNNAGYNASVFDTWLIVAKFGERNVPEYMFLTNPKENTKDSLWNEDIKDISLQLYTNRGENTKADSGIIGIVDVSKVIYYQYRGLNTYFFAPSSDYNTKYPGKDKLERFDFYRFTGTAIITPLDNCLMAVDRYSKLVFAYAKPTAWKNILPNVPVPSEWGSIDNNVEINGQKYIFYEYDPIGYVKKDGTVTLFQWYIDRVSTMNYDPTKSDISREIANVNESGNPGRSPYAF